MNADTMKPTRRAMLAAAPMLALIGAVPGCIQDAKAALAASRAAWGAAWKAFERATAEDRVYDAYYTKVRAAFDADMAKLPELPKGTLPPNLARAMVGRMDVGAVEREWFAEEGKAWWGSDGAAERYRERFQRVREHQAAYAEIERRHDMDAVETEWDRLGSARGDAEWALIETPAPDLHAVAWKLETLGERQLSFQDDVQAILLADVRRLAEEA